MTFINTPSASFTRPANTTAYASGDIVANSTTAASVVPLELKYGYQDQSQFVFVRRVSLRKSGTSITNASFRVHLFSAIPETITNGDNGALSVSGVADYLGAIDVTVDQSFTDGSFGVGIPNVGSEISITSQSSIYAIIEARGAYTPASGEVFTVKLETHRY